MSSLLNNADPERGWTNKLASASPQERAIMTQIENPATRAALRESLANRRNRDEADYLLSELLFLYSLTHSDTGSSQEPGLIVVSSKEEALNLLATAKKKNDQYLAQREKQLPKGGKPSFFNRKRK